MSSSPVTNTSVVNPSIGIVNTGAKNVGDLNRALEKLEEHASNQPVLRSLPAGAKEVGQATIFMGIDASDAVVLVDNKGKLELYEKLFGPFVGGQPGFHSGYRHIGDLGHPVTTDGKFDHRAKAYEYLSQPGANGKLNPGADRWEVAMTSDGHLYIEKPRVDQQHTLLSVLPPKSQKTGAATDDAQTAAPVRLGEVPTSEAQLIRPVRVKNGDFADLYVQLQHEIQQIGSNRPGGLWGKLNFDLIIKGEGGKEYRTREVYLGQAHEALGKDGAYARLNGQVATTHAQPGPSSPGGSDYALLFGISNLSTGQPEAKRGPDGIEFYSSKTGQRLDVLSFMERFIPDLPSDAVAIDWSQKGKGAHSKQIGTAFLGTEGGFVAHGPFHGFVANLKIMKPERADVLAVKRDGDKWVDSKTGAELRETGEDLPSRLGFKWYFNPSNSKLYGFTGGGIANLANKMSAVIDLHPAHKASPESPFIG